MQIEIQQKVNWTIYILYYKCLMETTEKQEEEQKYIYKENKKWLV